MHIHKIKVTLTSDYKNRLLSLLLERGAEIKRVDGETVFAWKGISVSHQYGRTDDYLTAVLFSLMGSVADVVETAAEWMEPADLSEQTAWELWGNYLLSQNESLLMMTVR